MFAYLKDRLTRDHQAKAPRPTSRRRARLAFEALEKREVLATGLVGLTPFVPVLHRGVLTIVGDSGSNTIDVTKSNNKVVFQGTSFDANSVFRIVIAGEKGNDTIRVSESINVPTIIYGGPGDDTILGGGGKDEIYGGSGRDTINGRAGNDTMYTGAGNDVVDGGIGNNTVNDASAGDRITRADSFIHDDSTLLGLSGFEGDVANEVFRLVNKERTSRGIAKLRRNAALDFVADSYTHTLRDLGVEIGQGISHAVSGHFKPTLTSRLDANLLNYNAWAENNAFVGGGSSLSAVALAKRAMDLWMNSSGHRANILSTNVTHFGIGLQGTNSSGFYLTQEFAALV